MCGRFVLSNFTDVKDFHNVLIEPSYNIAPSHHTLLINKEMRPDFLEWSYSPIWSKKPMNLINAKYESLDIKPSFKNYETCVFVADGWFEWQKNSRGEKHPIFIHADNEGQFASVIAHELAHVSQRHFARGILRGQDTNLASALVLISSIALAIVSNNPTAFIAGPAALAQEQLRYSRVFEREADRFGFNNLINAGYDPKTMGEMFENMAQIRRLSGDIPPEFLLTHPVTSSRISDAFNAADQVGVDGGKTNSPEYQFIKGRIEAKYFNRNANAEAYFTSQNDNKSTIQNSISLVTALTENRKFDEANEILSKLIENFPKNLILQTIKAEILFEAKSYDEALNVVNSILKVAPNNYPASVIKGRVLANKGEFLFAEQVIRDQLIKKNQNPNLWLLLSEIQRSAKNITGYHMSRGEYYLLLGKDQEAMNEFQFALRLVRNNFQVTESIMTKINEIKKNQRRR